MSGKEAQLPEPRRGIAVRELAPEERGLTRPLYEAVFSEDSPAFVDYYYREKTKDNRIFAAMDGETICAMLHLNPFAVNWRGRLCCLSYIVAVATLPEYRHRGLMRRLLEESLRAMYEKNEPFTFLMPAAEAIYRPFGFTYIAAQRRGRLPVEGKGKNLAPVRIVTWSQSPCPDEVNRWLGRMAGLYTWRSPGYYARLEAEQAAQEGGVFTVLAEDGPVGVFCTSGEEGKTAIRELICRPCRGTELAAALIDAGYGGAWVEGCMAEIPLDEEESVPLFMARPVSVPAFLDGLCRGCSCAGEPLDFTVDDPILQENCGGYRLYPENGAWRWRRVPVGGEKQKKVKVEELFDFLSGFSPFAGAFLNETV